jgi:D-lactate dehydrogenase
MAGDRGLLHPELPAAALETTRTQLAGRPVGGCICSNRTCEIALEQATGKPFASFALLLEQQTRSPTAGNF